MKKILFILFALVMTIPAISETVKLKVTYKGKGVSGHTVSVLIGGGKIGSGVTDDNGDVSISVSSLPTKSIDLAGEKTCDGGRKSWEVKGYVTLDGSNYAHLKMEDIIAEMVEASGGFMSENMMVASYGLVCGGSSSPSSSSSSTASSDSQEADESETTASTTTSTEPTMTREESLANQKAMLEDKIANIDRKISKKNSKINSGDLKKDKKNDAVYDVEELKIEKQIAQNKLDKVNMTIEKGFLKKADRNRFKDKEAALKEDLKAVKSDRKKGKSVSVSNDNNSNANSNESATNDKEDKEEEVEEDLDFTEADLADMSTINIKRKKVNLKSTLGKRKMKLKTKKKFLSPNELKALEQEIADIENAIMVLDNELVKRNGGEEETEE